MNNELIMQKENFIKRKYFLDEVIPILKGFLSQNSSKFTNEESLVALNKIREHLLLLEEESSTIYKNAKSVRRQLNETCTHDILKRDCNKNIYCCCICHDYFTINDIDFDCFLIDCFDNDYYYENIIQSIILDTAKKNENFFDEFEKKILEKSDNIMVYRRTK